MKKIVRSFTALFLLAVFANPLAAQEFQPQSTAIITQQTAPSDDISLYEQMSNPATTGTVSQDFTDYPTYSCQAADDFTVPGGITWFISEVDVSGFYNNGNGPVTVVNFFIYRFYFSFR